MTEAGTGLITVEELQQRLGAPGLRLVDASWYLPAANRDPAAEFAVRHIEGAVFFDIDAISDPDTDLPHMLPRADAFGRAVAAMGIGTGDEVVIYDTTPMFGACRVWWMFHAFGHADVRVLDGGLPRWMAAGLPAVAAPVPPGPAAHFAARLDRSLVTDLAAMRERVGKGGQIIDARPAARFQGSAPEPRAGLRAGHMPGARNLPFAEVLDPQTGCLLPPDALRARMAAAGIDPAADSVVSCGSGVTACVIALALHRLGGARVSVYDGSWAEWGGLADTPVATGAEA